TRFTWTTRATSTPAAPTAATPPAGRCSPTSPTRAARRTISATWTSCERDTHGRTQPHLCPRRSRRCDRLQAAFPPGGGRASRRRGLHLRRPGQRRHRAAQGRAVLPAGVDRRCPPGRGGALRVGFVGGVEFGRHACRRRPGAVGFVDQHPGGRGVFHLR